MSSVPDSSLIFVYGSLRRGGFNHALFAGARFLGEAATAPHYSLHDLGPYPALVAGGTTSVLGELYSLSPEQLAAADELEGHPTVYTRGPIALAAPHEIVAAEAWLRAPEAVAHLPLVPSGDWLAHLRSRR